MRSLALFAISAAIASSIPASITGTVVGADGKPIANAQVEAFRPVLSVLSLREPRPDPVAKTTTNTSGVFSLNVEGYGLVDLHVVVEGFAPADVIAVTDEPAETITLRPATDVEGKVTANGKPVANATVIVFAAEGPPFVTATSAEGKYKAPDPRVWAQSIVVRHPDFAPAWHPTTGLDFVLDAGQEIHGNVVDANNDPVAGAKVDISDLIAVTSDAAGKFTIAHAPRVEVLLRARSPSGIAMTRFGGGGPTLKLKPVARASGVVRDAEKHPLVGIPVVVGGPGFTDLAMTDVKGAFAIEMPRGMYQLGVYESSSRYVAEPVEIDANGGDVKRDLVVQRQKATEGLVKSEEGKPVAGAAISFVYDVEGMSSPIPTGKITAADGMFRVYSQFDRSARIRLAAVKPGLPVALSEPLTAGSPASRVAITIPKGVAISGIVAGKDGKPIVGVNVNPIIGTERVPREPLVPESWATTDERGQFSGRLTTSTKGMSFSKKGYVAAQQAVNVQSGMRSIEVVLAQGASIAGRVIKSDGSPAAEVMVSAGSGFVMSGADGSFVIESIEPGPQVLRFGLRIVQEQTVVAPAHDVTLRLAATRIVNGRVFDGATGTPIEKFTVTPTAAAEEFGIPVPFDSASGEFKVEVPAGSAKLSVQADGYAAAKNISADPASDQPISIKLSRGRILRGKVVDEKETPIAGVSIEINSAGPAFGDEGPQQTRADGSFELTGMGFDEDLRMTFQKAGYVKAQQKIKAGRNDANLDVILRRGLSLSGRVVNSSGAGVAGISVSASSAAHGAESEDVMTDASGSFHFATLAPAHYDFIATGKESGERGAAKDVDVEKIRELVVRLEKIPTATIFGHVSGLDSAISNRMVSARPLDGDQVLTAIDAGGNFRMENAPAGSIEVRAEMFARGATRRSPKVTIDVAAGSETRVDLAFAAPIAVHGHVLRGSTPIAGASIRFSGPGFTTAVTGAEGAYEAALDPAEYDVTINASDGQRLPFDEQIVVGDRAEFNFRVDATAITATVLDAQTEQPIGGATVAASRRGETHTLVTATTSADGTASVDLNRGELVTIVASRNGFANASQDLTPGEHQSIILRLARTPGAVVRVIDVRDGSTLAGYVIARDSSGRVVASATETDPDGTVTLPLAPGRYAFSASAEGFGSHTVNSDVPSGEIRVPLPRGGNLVIRSSNDAHGAARLIQPDGEEYVRCWCNGIAEIKLDGRSTFVDRISPGSYTLEVTLTGGKPKRFPISIVEGQSTTVAID